VKNKVIGGTGFDSPQNEFLIRLDKLTNKTVEVGIANPQLIAAELQIALLFGQRPLVRLNRDLLTKKC
jgi:hypothetical protein